MPEHDQTLARAADVLADKMTRWFGFQAIADEVFSEREAQLEQWGEQSLPLGFGGRTWKLVADQYRKECDEAAERGELTMRHILLEEFFEALAESDLKSARDELVQVGACIVQAIQLIDKERAG